MRGELGGLQDKWFDLEISVRAAAAARRNRGLVDARQKDAATDLFICLVDHYEPQIGRPAQNIARARVTDWLERYPQIADRHRDADGQVPPHSFFYPWDEFAEWEMARLAELCAAGYGEVDLHLHHRDDTEETLRAKLRQALSVYAGAGVLSHWPDERPAFGFIHGNWALDNSRHEDGKNFCGVNRELDVLREEGCFADFTFPAWKHRSQPRCPNRLYYAVDGPEPKSYESGTEVRQGGAAPERSLLLVQGPLAPYRRGMRTAMDDGDLAHYRRYNPARLDRWVRTAVHVSGRPDRLFIKLHTHGAADANREALLGNDLEALFTDAERRYNDGRHFRLHYVTAREMFNLIKATEAGLNLSPNAARNWVLPSPYAAPASNEA